MANNPKKVKDPTEVALSAIQEALNISDVSAGDSARSFGRATMRRRRIASAAPVLRRAPFDTRPGADRPMFDADRGAAPDPPRRQ